MVGVDLGGLGDLGDLDLLVFENSWQPTSRERAKQHTMIPLNLV